jgi:hypothetical protein
MKRIILLLLVCIFIVGCRGSGRNLLFDPEMIKENTIGDARPYTEATNIIFY